MNYVSLNGEWIVLVCEPIPNRDKGSVLLAIYSGHARAKKKKDLWRCIAQV